jgi:RNA polymerase sigma factor (sigma-70 family)
MSTAPADDTKLVGMIRLRGLPADELDRVSHRLQVVARRFGADGEDLVHEVFAKILQGGDPGYFIGQLITAIVRLGIARWRRRRWEVSLDGHADPPNHDKSPHENIMARENDLAVRSAFSKLRPLDQEILRLTVHEDLNCKEAAEALSISHPAARRRRHEALKRLGSSPAIQAILSEIIGGAENHV